jgi:hypothetical protein
MNNEHDSEAYVAHVLSTFETTARKTSKTPSIRERIKIGDYVNHHGFLAVVTWIGESGFTFETLDGGNPNGESFVCDYDSMSEKDPKPCWTTEA